MNTMSFYRTNSEPAKQIFQAESVKLEETPSFQVSYSHELKQGYDTNECLQFGDIGSATPYAFHESTFSNNFSIPSYMSTFDSTGTTTSVSGLVNDSFRLRHKVFAEELEWDVVSYNGREVDHFDLMDPYYAILNDDDGSVIGTWRALPTTSGYMLKDIFPELCRGEAPPERDDVWEISRFAVDKLAEKYQNKDNGVGRPVQDLVDSFSEFMEQKDLTNLVAVTSTAGERMLKRLGVKVRRFGDGKSIRIGRVESTAIWIES